MEKATFIRALKTIIAVLLVNGVFYAFYRIAAPRLSPALFTLGCVILVLVVVAICRLAQGRKVK